MPRKTNAERQKAYRERLKTKNAKRAEGKKKTNPTTQNNNTLECAIMSEQDYNDNTTDDIYPVAECRACLQILYSDSNLWNIFEPWTPPWDGMENTIAEDLIRLANIQISETDKHSKVICETCYQGLLGACHFTACVRKNDQILLERYPCESHQNLNDKVWPKPIQVDKIIHSSMFQNPMDIEVKQEVLSEDEYATFNGTFDDNKDYIPNLDIKIEPEEIQQATQVNVNVFKMGKTNAEHCKNCYNRKKAEKIQQGFSVEKPIKKTGAERTRAYRLRKKMLSQANESSVTDISSIPSTSNSRIRTFEPSFQLATTSASTNRPDVSTVSSTGIADHEGSISPAVAPEKGDVQSHVTNENTTSELNDLKADVKEPKSDEDSDPLSLDLPLESMLEEKHKELKRKRNCERQRAINIIIIRKI